MTHHTQSACGTSVQGSGEGLGRRLRPLRSAAIAVAVGLPMLVRPAIGADWPQWRGPSFNGFSPEKNLPVRWSTTSNVVWKATLPGPGAGTPAVQGGRVFLTAIEPDSAKTWAFALDAETGGTLWKRPVGVGFFGKTGNTAASPSPVADGTRVYFLFGTGELLACDSSSGTVLWRHDLQKEFGAFHILWRYGASPLLYGGRLYVAVIHQYTAVKPVAGLPKPASYLLCLDPATGRVLWRRPRPTDAAAEAMEAYTTPVPIETSAGPRIILAGGDHITAHDPGDGHEIWRSPSCNPLKKRLYRQVAMPVYAAGLIIGSVPRGNGMFALRPDGKGQLTDATLVWKRRANAPDVCTPLVMDERLYVLDGRRKVLSCLDPKTGRDHWRTRLETQRPFQASPTGADGRIYCIDLAGEVFVVSATDGKILSRIAMGGKGCRATIAAANGRLYIRTSETLYCVGRPSR